jgi:site-specific recombinase XerD
MTKVEPITNESIQSGSEVVREQPLLPTLIDRILQKLSCLELPAKDHLERYMHHKWRLNHKPRTLASSYTSVVFFLDFYGKSGKSAIERIERVDLEGFIEHEQDRGLRISTVRTRLACIIAFLHFLMEQDVITGSLLKRSIKLKLPEVLPRAMSPADVRKLLSVMDDIRDRALFLLLLRIGEALGLRLNDLDIRDRKVHLFEGEKNSMGRVVYLSDDALFAIKLWLRRRDKSKEFVFYGQSHGHLCYN